MRKVNRETRVFSLKLPLYKVCKHQCCQMEELKMKIPLKKRSNVRVIRSVLFSLNWLNRCTLVQQVRAKLDILVSDLFHPVCTGSAEKNRPINSCAQRAFAEFSRGKNTAERENNRADNRGVDPVANFHLVNLSFSSRFFSRDFPTRARATPSFSLG